MSVNNFQMPNRLDKQKKFSSAIESTIEPIEKVAAPANTVPDEPTGEGTVKEMTEINTELDPITPASASNSYLDNVIRKSSAKHGIQKTVYFEDYIFQILSKAAEKNHAKFSSILNTILKAYFEEHGIE